MLAFRVDLNIKKGGKDEQDVVLSGPLPIPQITSSSRLSQQSTSCFLLNGVLKDELHSFIF